MPLVKVQFRAGINREITSYSNEGGWYDGDKIRFRFGYPEKIGGWIRYTQYSYLGSARAMHPWITLDNSRYIGVGTNLKYYTIKDAGLYTDITPIRTTSAAGSVTFTATNGSSTIQVSHTAHGCETNDFVTFVDAVGLGGNITADVLNQEYQVTVVDTDNYTIEARTAGTTIASITVDGQLSPTLVVANASDTGNGGASAYGIYQINTGLDVATVGSGWGVSFWGRGAWGSATTLPADIASLRLWTHDNFGEDLLINVKNGGLYYWDVSVGGRAVELQALPGANKAPTIAKQILVSDLDRHVIAFGCDPETSPGVQDPLTIRFSSQESVTDWETRPDNTAGELRLGSGSEIISAVETRQQILVFTDSSLHTMQYLGPPFTFGISMVSENISVASPKAAVAIDDSVFWMGTNEFYLFNGAVQRIPCTVRDYVFDDFNEAQSEKVFAAANTSYSEVWWFYCSAGSQTVDRYVVFNYQENIWCYGTMTRTAWIERGVYNRPIAAGSDGYLYYHEIGADDGSTNPVSAISSYVESSPVDISDGENFQFIRRMLPDVSFVDSPSATPAVDITTTAKNYTNGSTLKAETFEIANDTQQVNMRLRGRQVSIRVASEDVGVKWRLGSMRYDIKPDGRR
jgi:hypothetical protein